jgi:DNA-binding transcriptional regulator YbjK
VTAYTPHIEEVRAVRATRDRVADLIKRYPQVSDKDRKEILQFMKEARHLEVGLLTSKEELRPQLDAFMEDHKKHFQLSTFDVLRALALIGTILTVLWLMRELFMPVSS